MVCIEKSPGISHSELAAYEEKFGRLPEDYREFLLESNGMELIASSVAKVTRDSVSLYLPVDWFFGVHGASVEGGGMVEEEVDDAGAPEGYAWVAASASGRGVQYLMSTRQDDFGKIYYSNPDGEDPRRQPQWVADSFAEFFGNILDYEPGNAKGEQLFNILHERHLKTKAEWEALMQPSRKKPWWKIW